MNEEEFITNFYSCDNEEQFLKDICHNLNCLQKVQNNWNELKKWLENEMKIYGNEYYGSWCKKILEKLQELEGNNE